MVKVSDFGLSRTVSADEENVYYMEHDGVNMPSLKTDRAAGLMIA